MIEAGIVSLLSADATLSALVGKRIYPVLVPESTAYPCLSYQVVSGSTDVALDSTSVQTKRIQFDIWAADYAEVKGGEIALANVLDGYEGTLSDGSTVLSSSPGVVIDFWEDSSRVYRVMVEYIFQFTS